MPAQVKDRHVQVKRDGLSGAIDGVPFVVNEGDILPVDDPIVKNYPDYFEEVKPSRQRPDVEEMTAEPGKKRGA